MLSDSILSISSLDLDPKLFYILVSPRMTVISNQLNSFIFESYIRPEGRKHYSPISLPIVFSGTENNMESNSNWGELY